MFQRLNHRGGHYGVIVLAWAVLCLPNLGAPSLWDVDEGRNAAHAPVISPDGAPVAVRVIRTNEELMIARQTFGVVNGAT